MSMQAEENKKIQGLIPVALSDYQPVSASEKLQRIEDSNYVKYGDDNLYPSYLNELSQTAPVHGALTRSIIQMIAGKGWEGVDQTTIDNLKLNDLLEPIASDLKKQGGFYLEVIRSLDGQSIAKINHLPFANCRLSVFVEDEVEKINGIWFSRNWANLRTKGNKPRYLPLMDKEAMKRKEQASGVFISFSGTSTGNAYPSPDYAPAINFIELERQIGIYHVNNIMNGFFPAFIINYFNGIPEPDQKAAIIREWERHAEGARNAGKAFFSFNEAGVTAPQITTFPISDADKQYAQLSDEATRKIMIGHRVVSPLLFGIRDSSGLGSNKEEMLVAFEIFNNQVLEPYQRQMSKAMGEILDVQAVVIPNSPIALSAQKKKHDHDLTDAEGEKILASLDGKWEVVDMDEWELVSEDDALEDPQEEITKVDGIQLEMLANEGSYANGDQKSKWGDAGLYKLRYGYSTNITADSREFCKRMVALSLSGALFRKEDIIAMGDDGINGQFAPEGQSTYDIFRWKGGAFCHHYWKRYIFMRKRGKDGAFLPNKGLENDKRVANNPFVPKKGMEGKAPITTPSRGSLKYG